MLLQGSESGEVQEMGSLGKQCDLVEEHHAWALGVWPGARRGAGRTALIFKV